jgi:hypothetical protein
MEAFGKFWDGNALMIGIIFSLLALAVAIVLRNGTAASVLGLIGGMGFMWVGKPAPPVATDDDI